MSSRGLRALPSFRGPSQTVILFDPWLEMWLVSGWDGGEVLIPEADLAAFLDHCQLFLSGEDSK